MRRLLCATLVLIALFWPLARPALAIATLTSSEPPDRAIIDIPPSRVRATFSEAIRSGELRVLDTRGNPVDNGDGGIDPADAQRRTLVATLGRLAEGNYNAVWTTVSDVDGQVAQGVFSFGVQSRPLAPTATATAAPTETAAPTSAAPTATQELPTTAVPTVVQELPTIAVSTATPTVPSAPTPAATLPVLPSAGPPPTEEGEFGRTAVPTPSVAAGGVVPPAPGPVAPLPDTAGHDDWATLFVLASVLVASLSLLHMLREQVRR